MPAILSITQDHSVNTLPRHWRIPRQVATAVIVGTIRLDGSGAGRARSPSKLFLQDLNKVDAVILEPWVIAEASGVALALSVPEWLRKA